MEIKANELRIGNIVDYKGTAHRDVVICAEDIVDLDNGGMGKLGIELSGIPITEEWLAKFGFTREITSTEIRWYAPKTMHRVILYRRGQQWGCTYPHPIQEFNFVHQLQNLFFALTGKELIKNE